MSERIAPHIRTDARAWQMTLDVLIAGLVLCIFSAVNYGPRPLLLVLFSMLSAIAAEAVCTLLRRRSLRVLLDGSAAVTGMLVGLAMSPMTDHWVPMLGSAFAIVVAKAPFGGYGRNVFDPAAAGIAVVSFCFPPRVFTYPVPSALTRLPLMAGSTAGQVAESSLAAQLRAGATPNVTRMQLLLGDLAGPIGGTATLILLACALYLMIRRTASPWLILPYIGTFALLAWLFPCAGVDRNFGVLAQLCSGYVLFTGVFLLCDPVTAPRYRIARAVYAVMTAALVLLLQRIGRLEAGSCFAIMIMNTLSPIVDRWCWHIKEFFVSRRRARQEVRYHG